MQWHCLDGAIARAPNHAIVEGKAGPVLRPADLRRYFDVAVVAVAQVSYPARDESVELVHLGLR